MLLGKDHIVYTAEQKTLPKCNACAQSLMAQCCDCVFAEIKEEGELKEKGGRRRERSVGTGEDAFSQLESI